MGLKSYAPKFPEAGSYLKYWDTTAKQVKYRHTLWRRGPMYYDRRFAAVAADSTASAVALKEIRPSKDSNHIYLAYIGVKQGVLCQIYHPADVRILKWDEALTDIDENKTGAIDDEASPFDFPTFSIGVDYNNYPSVAFRNSSGASVVPWISIVASMYRVIEHDKLTKDELQRLEDGRLKSYPWDFGGQL